MGTFGDEKKSKIGVELDLSQEGGHKYVECPVQLGPCWKKIFE